MPQPRDATDLRRADDAALLAALESGQPLALAEAYHRSVPAAHAVARRLVGGAGPVEELLLAVYTELWTTPPAEGPLEGWARRTTWSLGAERLRETGTAPASPSAAGLLPDLPAPEVRFLDAAERAIADLPDDERRALLLAHDRGTPTSAQEDGAGQALLRALVALAGPESSGTDADAMAADPCVDVAGLGDWCLALLDLLASGEVDAVLEGRPGCAATSRVARRGRRRIEGLPATPDMGQRILVTVLTTGGATTAAPAPITDPEDASPFAPPAAEDAVAVGMVAAVDEADETTDAEASDAEGDLVASVDDQATVGDTADLPRTADQAEAADVDTGSWMPGPGDATAELRLSDILSDEGEEDDPFAGLDDDEPAPAAPVTRDPYSALRGLDQSSDPSGPQGPISPAFAGPDPTPRSVSRPGQDDEVVDGYVEGQEEEPAEGVSAPRSALAAILAWVLPILGGSAIGILVAIQIFGLPG